MTAYEREASKAEVAKLTYKFWTYLQVIKWYENSKSGGASSIPTQPQPVVNGQHPEVASEDDGDADNWQVMGPKNKGCVTRKTTIDKSPISEMLFGQLCSALQRTNDRNNVRNLQPFFTLQLDIQVSTFPQYLSYFVLLKTFHFEVSDSLSLGPYLRRNVLFLHSGSLQ